MNRWNYDINFNTIYMVDEKPHPYSEYTLTVIDFDAIEKRLDSQQFTEANQILSRFRC